MGDLHPSFRQPADVSLSPSLLLSRTLPPLVVSFVSGPSLSISYSSNSHGLFTSIGVFLYMDKPCVVGHTIGVFSSLLPHPYCCCLCIPYFNAASEPLPEIAFLRWPTICFCLFVFGLFFYIRLLLSISWPTSFSLSFCSCCCFVPYATSYRANRSVRLPHSGLEGVFLARLSGVAGPRAVAGLRRGLLAARAVGRG